MYQSLKRFRIVAFAHQAGRCYYCGLPMWMQDPLSFARQYGITPRQAKRLQCTAEHLKARQDGGEDSFANLVAACLYCNQMRHRYKVAPTPDRYRNRVQARMSRKQWHGPWVFQAAKLAVSAPPVVKRAP